MKKIVISLLAVAVLAAVACAATLYHYIYAPQLHPQSTVHIYIDRDDTPDSVLTKLTLHAHPGDLRGMRWLMRYHHYDTTAVRTGRYPVHPEDNVYHTFSRLLRGYQDPMNLTVGSARTLGALARHVSRQIMADSAEIANALHDSATVVRLGYTQQTLPALFIPDTYQVYWDMTAEDFLQRMQREHNRWWTDQRQERAAQLGLTPLEVSILASIVEEETNDSNEKPIVAGLYLNRLRRGMLLQADPTVKFAVGDPTLRRITHAHLATPSPYNTYLNPGLPPGPIRIPTPAGLLAVLNAAEHNYLYMCAKEDLSGTHRFAATLAEHNRNAARYQAALNARHIYR